jgi:RNA polymerase sigma-70 factor (ECF subfamily)
VGEYNIYTDRELLSFLKSDNHAAFAEIYNRYWSIMYMHALKMLCNEEDARDTVQEVFTTLWTKAAHITSGANLAGYLYVATKNRVIDLIAQHKVRANYLESLSLFIDENSNTIVEAITQKELMLALYAEIEQLPPKMKVIVEMRIKQQLSYKAIAEELDISDTTVKKQISNSIKILKTRLKGFNNWIVFFQI